MKLLNSLGPNPRMVRMFMAEKGITLPLVEHNLLGGENREESYVKKNPSGQIPALELDDGSVIGETVAICEYLEELNPTPALIGSNARERADGRMWARRIEMNITEYMYFGFRSSEGFGLFKDRTRCLPDAADGLKTKAQDGMKWLDGLMAGKDYIGGDKIGIADIILYCCVDFAASAGQPLNPELKNINAWFKRMDARPSANATIASNWKELGMRV